MSKSKPNGTVSTNSSITAQCWLTDASFVSFLDNREERGGLVLGELVLASKLQSVVIEIEQYCTQMVLLVVVNVESVCQLPASHTFSYREALSQNHIWWTGGSPKNIPLFRGSDIYNMSNGKVLLII